MWRLLISIALFVGWTSCNSSGDPDGKMKEVSLIESKEPLDDTTDYTRLFDLTESYFLQHTTDTIPRTLFDYLQFRATPDRIFAYSKYEVEKNNLFCFRSFYDKTESNLFHIYYFRYFNEDHLFVSGQKLILANKELEFAFIQERYLGIYNEYSERSYGGEGKGFDDDHFLLYQFYYLDEKQFIPIDELKREKIPRLKHRFFNERDTAQVPMSHLERELINQLSLLETNTRSNEK